MKGEKGGGEGGGSEGWEGLIAKRATKRRESPEIDTQNRNWEIRKVAEYSKIQKSEFTP